MSIAFYNQVGCERLLNVPLRIKTGKEFFIKKRGVIAFLLVAILGFGIVSPKAHADEISGSLTYCGGGIIGLGVGSLIVMPEEKGIGVGCISVGAVMVIGGIWYALANGESIFFTKAMNDTDSPLHYVKFDTNGKDLSLSVKFDY